MNFNQRFFRLMRKSVQLIFLLCPVVANGNVTIYKNDYSVLAYEEGQDNVATLTLSGGSNDAGASSPADCTVKLALKQKKGTWSADLAPFHTELMDYDDVSRDVALIERDRQQIRLYFPESLSVCPLGTEFSGDYKKIEMNDASFKDNFNVLLAMNYYSAISEARGGKTKQAITYLEPYMKESLSNNIYNMAVYNDYGYFLQKAGRAEESISYFEKVIENNPGRIVVYLNMADSYWIIGEEITARSYYAHYKKLMSKVGKNNLIPGRVADRLNE